MSGVLLTGFLSTVGDLLALRVAREAFARRGWRVSVAPLHAFLLGELDGARDWRTVATDAVDVIAMVCGPLPDAEAMAPLFARFPHAMRISLGQSIDTMRDAIDGFATVFARDRDGMAQHPDLSFLAADSGLQPRVGVCWIDAQPEYGARQRHALGASAVELLFHTLDAQRVDLDTRYPAQRNSQRLRTPEEFRTAMSSVDVLVTNRLHGLALGLQCGIPVVAIDSISDGAKVSAQAIALGWPYCLSADGFSLAALRTAVLACLQPEAKRLARAVAAAARQRLATEWEAHLENQVASVAYRPPKVQVYTAIVGGTDQAPRAPALREEGVDYVCFTDAAGLHADGWRVEPLPFPVQRTARRTARHLKLMSHKLFGAGVTTLWLDATFSPNVSVHGLADEYLGAANLATVRHPWRRCVYAEAEACIAGGNDDPARIHAQMQRYRAFGMPEDYGLAATGFMLRRHTPEVMRFNEAWWAELDAYSLRDQLSFDAVRWVMGLPVGWLDVDYYHNPLYAYAPHISPPAW